MNNTEEKRRTTRADYNIECTLDHDNTSYRCKIKNISFTGILIEIIDFKSIKTGDKALIIIKNFVDNNIISEIDCKIERIENTCIGMKYHAIDYETLMKIKDLTSRIIQDEQKIDNEIINLIEKN